MCIPILIIISPSCLSVDSAIIFFISHSVIALRPAINIVVVPINSRDLENKGADSKNG